MCASPKSTTTANWRWWRWSATLLAARASNSSASRYILNADRSSAEFAIVIADAWQGRGVGQALMQRLMNAGRANGIPHFEGTVLRSNHNMLRFAEALGFTAQNDRADLEQVVVSRER